MYTPPPCFAPPPPSTPTSYHGNIANMAKPSTRLDLGRTTGRRIKKKSGSSGRSHRSIRSIRSSTDESDGRRRAKSDSKDKSKTKTKSHKKRSSRSTSTSSKEGHPRSRADVDSRIGSTDHGGSNDAKKNSKKDQPPSALVGVSPVGIREQWLQQQESQGLESRERATGYPRSPTLFPKQPHAEHSRRGSSRSRRSYRKISFQPKNDNATFVTENNRPMKTATREGRRRLPEPTKRVHFRLDNSGNDLVDIADANNDNICYLHEKPTLWWSSQDILLTIIQVRTTVHHYNVHQTNMIRDFSAVFCRTALHSSEQSEQHNKSAPVKKSKTMHQRLTCNIDPDINPAGAAPTRYTKPLRRNSLPHSSDHIPSNNEHDDPPSSTLLSAASSSASTLLDSMSNSSLWKLYEDIHGKAYRSGGRGLERHIHPVLMRYRKQVRASVVALQNQLNSQSHNDSGAAVVPIDIRQRLLAAKAAELSRPSRRFAKVMAFYDALEVTSTNHE